MMFIFTGSRRCLFQGRFPFGCPVTIELTVSQLDLAEIGALVFHVGIRSPCHVHHDSRNECQSPVAHSVSYCESHRSPHLRRWNSLCGRCEKLHGFCKSLRESFPGSRNCLICVALQNAGHCSPDFLTIIVQLICHQPGKRTTRGETPWFRQRMHKAVGTAGENGEIKPEVSGCRFCSTRCRGRLDIHNSGIFYEWSCCAQGESRTGYNRPNPADFHGCISSIQPR